jgi:ATP-binding protein involved in chromosome partitioning
MELTEKNVLDALRKVMDPDLHKDLVSLGMIENIQIENNQVRFKVVLTTPACPLKNKIRQDCITAVQAHFGTEISVDPEMGAKVTTQQKSSTEKERLPGVKNICLLYTSPSPRDRTRSRMPSSA